jgi:hypothetical protein
VPSYATAITANLTVVNATTSGFVSLGPTMTRTPTTSTINVMAGKTIANGVTVSLNAGRAQAVWVGKVGSSADLILDVTGCFLHSHAGLQFFPVNPYRVMDSRSSLGVGGIFQTGTPQSLTVGGTGGPTGCASDASGIAGNLTLISPTSTGWAAVAPKMDTIPSSSTVNSYAGITVSNGFDVSLDQSAMAKVGWYGTTGSTAHRALDVNGYWK